MGFNMQKLMKQAQKMQEDMARLQNELAEMEIEGSAGGGLVKATVNGKQEVLSLTIAPEAVDPDDIELLEDLVLAAIADAQTKSAETTAAEMQRVTGNMPNIPGLNGLF